MKNPSTKKKIIEAFMDILASKPIKQITVKDIALAAGVSNMTFYRNFTDKYALIGEICYEDMVLFSKIYGRNAEWKSIVYCILNTMKNNKNFYGKVCADEESMKECLDALARVSITFTGAQASKSTYVAWEDTLYDWAKRGFTDPIETVYRNLVASMPLKEIYSGEALDRAIRMYETNTMDDFKNRTGK